MKKSKNKKKVLMIGLTPPLEGGSQRHIFEISERLGLSVLTQKGSLCKGKVELPVSKKSVFLRNMSFAFLCFVYSLKLLLFKKKYDLIHIHENILYPLAVILRIRYKVIITVHGIVGFKFYENKFLWFFFSLGLRACNKIISVSVSDKEILDKNFNKVVYVPNGVDVGVYEKIKPRKIEKKISFVGRIHEQKGTDILIDAFEKVSKEFPAHSLNIIARKEGKFYEALSEKSKNLKVNWEGFILDRKKIFSKLAESELLVFPSRWEALPWPALLEGLGSGRPVIASDLNGMRSVFKDRKEIILVEKEDSDSLAKEITEILKNKKLGNKIGMSGKKKSKEFTWDIISEKTDKVYEGIK
jgi:glycosyltransferase involved in cell wall biosynthesis